MKCLLRDEIIHRQGYLVISGQQCKSRNRNVWTASWKIDVRLAWRRGRSEVEWCSRVCNKPSIRPDHSSWACGEPREGSEHAHTPPLDKTRESWALVGWLDRAMPRLSNNDGLLASLLRSRPIHQTLCQKKSSPGTQNIIDWKSLLTWSGVGLV